MNNLDNLYVRACKSLTPERCLRSLYRRFYFSDKDVSPHVLWGTIHANLLRISQKNNIKVVEALIDGLNPHNSFKYGMDDNDCYHLKVTKILCSCIRYAAITSFEGYKSPAKYRKKFS